MVGRLYGMSRAQAKARGRELLDDASTCSTPPTARRRPTPAACAGAWTSPTRSSPSRRSSSSTSRRRASTRAAGSTLWETIEELVAERHDRPADDPVPRRGRPPRRPDRGHRPRPGHRRRHAGRAQGPRRRRAPRGARSADASEAQAAVRGARGDVRRAAGRRRRDGRARRRAPAQRRDRRGRPPARRGRRRASTTSALRRPTLDDVFLSLTGHAAEATRRRGGDAHEAAGDGHDGHHRAQPRPAHARARPGHRVHDPAGDVPAAVRLRLRRRDRHAGLRLHGLPAARASSSRTSRSAGSSRRSGSTRTSRRASSTASARCRWRARRCSPGARCPTSSRTALSVVVLLATGLIIGFSFDASLVEIVAGVRPAAALRLRVLVGLRAARDPRRPRPRRRTRSASSRCSR